MTERQKSTIAVVGMGVMGANLARNLASRGHSVVVFNRTVERARELAGRHPEANFVVASTLQDLVDLLERPRRIVLMVPAGAPVDEVLDGLDALLAEGDVVADGGNSLFTDTERRARRAEGRPWRFLGMGVSGGAEGALKGPSIMPGGDERAFSELRPWLESIAAESDSGKCVTYCGRGSAGHFVKMVHNGIEYGDMQLIAETAMLLRRGLGATADEAARTFEEWNRGELDSFLVDITADIFRTKDPKASDGSALVDSILDRAGQKGTGRWTVEAALGLGVAIPTIAAAVDARVMSASKDLRVAAEKQFGRPGRALLNVTVEDLRDALYASKIASYTQGFSMLSAASAAHDYGTQLPEVARIWTAGCIIRARFLARVRRAFESEPAPALMALSPEFAQDLAKRVEPWRKVVACAALAGFAVPGLSASLSWFNTLTTATGSASLIQAQRDYFGSHTYERVDAPGTFVHTEWPRRNSG